MSSSCGLSSGDRESTTNCITSAEHLIVSSMSLWMRQKRRYLVVADIIRDRFIHIEIIVSTSHM